MALSSDGSSDKGSSGQVRNRPREGEVLSASAAARGGSFDFLFFGTQFSKLFP